MQQVLFTFIYIYKRKCVLLVNCKSITQQGYKISYVFVSEFPVEREIGLQKSVNATKIYVCVGLIL